MLEKMTLLNQLWGGVVVEYGIDFIQHSFTLKVRVIDHGVESNHDVRFQKLSSLEFADKLAEPWDYIELTSIEAVKVELEAYELWRVEIELWDATLRILCHAIDMDGELLNK